MTDKKSKTSTAPMKSSSQKTKTYSGVMKHPGTKKTIGRIYMKEDHDNNSLKYGTIVLVGVLAALAATFSSVGNAVIDQFDYSGPSAADLWWFLVAIAGLVGFILYIVDWLTKGKF